MFIHYKVLPINRRHKALKIVYTEMCPELEDIIKQHKALCKVTSGNIVLDKVRVLKITREEL